MVQQLRLWVSSPRGTGLILSWGTKIPHAMKYGQKKKKKKVGEVGQLDFPSTSEEMIL